MKFLHVKTRKGKKVPITLFTDWDLIFCFPVFIWNVLMWFVIHPLIRGLYRMMDYPISRLFGDKLNMGKTRIAFLSCLPMINLLAIYAVYIFMPDISSLYQALFIAISIMISTTGSELLIFLHNRMLTLDFAKSRARAVMEKEADTVPEYLVDNKRTCGLVVTASMITVHMTYNLIFLFILSNAGYYYFVPLLSILQVTLYLDKEFIEHIASHARNGRCVRSENVKTLLDRIYVYVNFVRVYLVWPLQLWMADFYYCTHTGIHHVENNGPADSQSTLRFDQTSFLSSVKAVTWYSFLLLIPIDALRYFISLNRKKFLKRFVSGWIFGISLLCIVTYFHPLLGVALIANQIGSGLSLSLFVHRWHGFHDSTRPYSVEASNNSPIHYGHHKQPSTHVTFAAEYARIFWQSRESDPKKFPVFHSSDALEMYTRNWLLVVSMLWQNKLHIVEKFVVTDASTAMQLKKYVTGIRFINSSILVRRADSFLSKKIGKYMEFLLKKMQSKEDMEYIYSESNNLLYEMKVMDFNRFKVLEGETEFPSGVY